MVFHTAIMIFLPMCRMYAVYWKHCHLAYIKGAATLKIISKALWVVLSTLNKPYIPHIVF